ncbi:MAG TPA: YrdB family protein [Nocardioidaceae bacterium]|nr:YrdB family protein [Nocardioidaceae bacterium]
MEESRDLNGPWLALAVVRFTAELGMLAALFYVGWRLAPDRTELELALAAALPVAAALTWNRWIAPRARRRLEDPTRLAVELVLFGAAVVGLAVVGPGAWSLVAAAVLGIGYAVSAPVGRRGF